MTRTLKSLLAEATEHGISIVTKDIYIQFKTTSGDVVAWMAKNGSDWTGFTSQPDVTGRKHGSKSVVMDWCTDWAINGF